ncbi:MAG: branched-chain amino acid ABC transporter permease [Alphaproteobacteria bacterium]|nr:branched-chain amino acid ABC transporter permease [Alphaproteobacteria bacterium]
MSWRGHLIVGLLSLAIAVALPFVFNINYLVTQVTLAFIYGTVVTQWNLVYGVAGIFSLAQMALFAVGAYAAAMLGFYFGWSLWIAMPVAALITVVVSVLIGLACLRLRGPYVALLTLAIAQVLYLVIVNDTDCYTTEGSGCLPFFGGVRGLTRFGELGFREWLGEDWRLGNYFVALALLALALIFSAVIMRGPLGLAFRALRDNPGLARSRGISRFKYQIWVFALSAFFTGLAGAFYAANYESIGPTVFSFSLLLFLIAMMTVGGIGTLWGPLLGAILLMGTDEVLRDYQEWRDIGLGLLLVFFVILLPQGLVGLINWRRERVD